MSKGTCYVDVNADEVKFMDLFHWLCKERRHAVHPHTAGTIIIAKASSITDGLASLPMTDLHVNCVCIRVETHLVSCLTIALSNLATNDNLIVGFSSVFFPELKPDQAEYVGIPFSACAHTTTVFYPLKVGI